VVHRDLKPENLLLDATGTLKVSDFGLASVYMLKATGKTRMLSDVCGSLPYVAPEVTLLDLNSRCGVRSWRLYLVEYAKNLRWSSRRRMGTWSHIVHDACGK
jgi:serine/threonine-protein kinase CHEK1